MIVVEVAVVVGGVLVVVVDGVAVVLVVAVVVQMDLFIIIFYVFSQFVNGALPGTSK